MSKSNTTETDVLNLLFNSTALPWNTTATLYISLHNGDPGEGGTQSSNETSYGSYARQPVVRGVSGWSVSGNQAQNVFTVSFPECSSGTDTLSYVAIGITLAGAGQILYSGALSANRAVSSGITPQFAAGSLTITED